MRIFIYAPLFIFLTTTFIFCVPSDDDSKLQPYLKVLSEHGKDPITFVIDNFKNRDLLIFDDALHTAVEPFEFYQKLINTPSFFNNIKTCFPRSNLYQQTTIS